MTGPDSPAGLGSQQEPTFYQELTRRNAGIVSARQQQALRDARVLVAGCGSVGGAAVQPLVRLGVRDLVLADCGDFELNNLNRQQATVDDVDRNKAVVAGERALAINPYARVQVHPQGITAGDVDRQLAAVDMVVDGVDVTTPSGLAAKFLLHEQALARRLPLVTGWDMAGVQYLQVYDYRRLRTPFKGRITREDLRWSHPWELILRLIPDRRIPAEMLAEVSPRLQDPTYSVPQVVYAAAVFGAATAHLVARVVAGERVREDVLFDVHQAVRPWSERCAARMHWPREAWRMRRARARLRAAVRSAHQGAAL